ncbi:MAG: hypothetical protein AB8C84_01955 [Oligoflexales bacterium]
MNPLTQGSPQTSKSLARILISDTYSTLTFSGYYTGNVDGTGCLALSKPDWKTIQSLLSKTSNCEKLHFCLQVEHLEETFSHAVIVKIHEQPHITTHSKPHDEEL